MSPTSESVEAGLARVLDEAGRVDVLVNNAGVGGNGVVEEVTIERYAEVMNVNLYGAIRCLKVVLPGMRERRPGTIVNITSVAGRFGAHRAGALRRLEVGLRGGERGAGSGAGAGLRDPRGDHRAGRHQVGDLRQERRDHPDQTGAYDRICGACSSSTPRATPRDRRLRGRQGGAPRDHHRQPRAPLSGVLGRPRDPGETPAHLRRGVGRARHDRRRRHVLPRLQRHSASTSRPQPSARPRRGAASPTPCWRCPPRLPRARGWPRRSRRTCRSRAMRWTARR